MILLVSVLGPCALIVGPAEGFAQWRKHGPYVDPNFGTPAQYAARVVGRAVGPCLADDVPLTASATVAPGLSCPEVDCPPATDALLRVWVDEGASVRVNGQATKPQKLAGGHRGSRHFRLTGLQPGVSYEAVIEARHGQSAPPIILTELVQAGKSYDVRFPMAPQAAEAPLDQHAARVVAQAERLLVEVQQIQRESRRLTEQAVAARSEAQAARDEASREAQRSQAAAEAAAAERVRAEQLAVRAEQAARQAARSNDETFEFVHDHQRIVAWATYAAAGRLDTLLFDAPSTWRALEIRETSGSLVHLDGVQIRLRFEFLVQSSDGMGGQQTKPLGELTHIVTFERGRAEVGFFDPAHPDQHLSARFRDLLMQHWSRRFEGSLIKVAIHAVRPNGTETPVAPEGNRMTIEVKTQP